jgi:hypothetical protein
VGALEGANLSHWATHVILSTGYAQSPEACSFCYNYYLTFVTHLTVQNVIVSLKYIISKLKYNLLHFRHPDSYELFTLRTFCELYGQGREERSFIEQLAVPGHALLWPFPVTD